MASCSGRGRPAHGARGLAVAGARSPSPRPTVPRMRRSPRLGRGRSPSRCSPRLAVVRPRAPARRWRRSGCSASSCFRGCRCPCPPRFSSGRARSLADLVGGRRCSSSRSGSAVRSGSLLRPRLPACWLRAATCAGVLAFAIFALVGVARVAVDARRRRAALSRHHAEPAARRRSEDREQPPARRLPRVLRRPLAPHYIRRGRNGEIYSIHAPGLPALVLRRSPSAATAASSSSCSCSRRAAARWRGSSRGGRRGARRPHGSAGPRSRSRRRPSSTASRSFRTGPAA